MYPTPVYQKEGNSLKYIASPVTHFLILPWPTQEPGTKEFFPKWVRGWVFTDISPKNILPAGWTGIFQAIFILPNP